MSHEIRTPMSGIMGFAGLLKEPGLTGETQQEYIQIIEKSGERMLNIINNIVNISKIESGLIELNLKATNINEQIEDIYSFFKPEAEKKGILLSFSNSLPKEEVSLRTDREKFNSILINLIKNAIKYTHKGSIDFGYSLRLAKDGLVKQDELLFYVKDTGIGIPKNRQEAVFERFIQADIADRQAYQGAGLGLSISTAYIKMLGGTIWLESEECKGSTFYFTLPYQTELEEKNLVQNNDRSIKLFDKDNSEIPRLKILIIEDDEISEILIETLVKKIGKTLFKARTGIEAVSLCRNNPDIDLVLMDIQMPEMDGYEATRQIREFNKEVMIFAQTAYALEGDKEKAIAAGCNDYIAKPIKVDELKQMIIKYM